MRNRIEYNGEMDCYRVYFCDGSFFIIDSADLEIVRKRTWFKGKRGYPVSHPSRTGTSKYQSETLHRYLLNPEKGFDVDHVSGNKLDNRRINLRICTHQENCFNQKLRQTNTSGYMGVAYHRAADKYEAYVHKDGKKHYLGLFDTAEKAAAVRDRKAIELFGDYANLNFTAV